LSTEQRENLEAALRRSPVPVGSSVSEQRKLPAAAFVMSPYADLTLAGATMDTKSDVDALLSRELLQPRVTDYTAGRDPALSLISPVFADLSGLPPLIIQAGTHEVLLDDAVRLAQKPPTPTSRSPST
jgi:epsilon-lactone hydrolase